MSYFIAVVEKAGVSWVYELSDSLELCRQIVAYGKKTTKRKWDNSNLNYDKMQKGAWNPQRYKFNIITKDELFLEII